MSTGSCEMAPAANTAINSTRAEVFHVVIMYDFTSPDIGNQNLFRC
jgi:hypothetical protein